MLFKDFSLQQAILISIGKLTPAKISTLALSIIEIARLRGAAEHIG